MPYREKGFNKGTKGTQAKVKPRRLFHDGGGVRLDCNKMLVTGDLGFIGSNYLRYLESVGFSGKVKTWTKKELAPIRRTSGVSGLTTSIKSWTFCRKI